MTTEVIRTENLTKVFVSNWRRNKTRAVDGLTMSVSEGEIYGFIGPNGAGKTTSLKMLLGLLKATSGFSSVFGQAPQELEFRREIGFLPENPYFYDYLTGAEFLDFYGRLFDLSPGLRRERIARLLKAVDLEHAAGLNLRKYSKGMLQRIGMAQALINDPKLLILDEPQSGLDPAGRKKVRDLILDARREGKTVFFSSHILSDAEMICDRVGIIDGGRLVATGDMEELLKARTRSIGIQAEGLAPGAKDELKRRAATFLESGSRIEASFPGGEEQIPDLLRILAEGDGRLLSLVPHRDTLEDVFLREVGKENK